MISKEYIYIYIAFSLLQNLLACVVYKRRLAMMLPKGRKGDGETSPRRHMRLKPSLSLCTQTYDAGKTKCNDQRWCMEGVKLTG